MLVVDYADATVPLRQQAGDEITTDKTATTCNEPVF